MQILAKVKMRMKKRLICLLLSSSLTASMTTPYSNLQIIYANQCSTQKQISAMNTSGITVTKSNTTVTIRDTVSSSLDDTYLTSTNFSAEQLATIASASTIIFDCSKEIQITGCVLKNYTVLKTIIVKAPKITGSEIYFSCPNVTSLIFDGSLSSQLYCNENVTITLNGEDNVIKSSISILAPNSSLIINGKTKFMGSLIMGSPNRGALDRSVPSITINADVTFSSSYTFSAVQNTFYCCTIDNLYIKKDPAKYIHFENNMRFGNTVNINNLYLDYTADDSTISAKNSLSLASSSDAQLQIGSIYFTNPNCNYTSLNLQNITGIDSKSIQIYGYGGAIAYNNNGKKVLSKDMFEDYAVGYGNYNNYIKDIQVDASTLPANVNLKKGENSTTCSFKDLGVSATYLNAESPADGSTYTKQLVQQTTEKATDTADSAYKYAIYVPVSCNPVTSSDEYVYEADNTQYSLLKQDNCTFPSGTYNYYIEVGGIFKKYSITVNPCKIEEIAEVTFSDGAGSQLVGSTLTKEQISVKVRYTNDNNLYTLTEDEYSLENATIFKEGNNTVEVIVPRKNNTSLIKELTVTGYTDTVTGYNAACTDNRTEMRAYTKLTTKDVKLTNVTYSNPNHPATANVYNGFSFIANGEKTDTIEIQPGNNSISIEYGGHIVENAIQITGYIPESYDVISDYHNMYIGTCLTVGNVHLENVVYNNSQKTKEDYVEKGFHFIVDGKVVDKVDITKETNIIGITYNGRTMDNAIIINGIVNDIEKITAEYIGPTMYEGMTVATNSAIIRITAIHTDKSITVSTTQLDVIFDTTYHIRANEKNEIEVYYQGIPCGSMIIYGEKDKVKEITNVSYIGSKTALNYDISDFCITAFYSSGRTRNTVSEPDIAKDFSLTTNDVTTTRKILSIAYTNADEKSAQTMVELDGTNTVVSFKNVTSTTTPTMTPDNTTATPQPPTATPTNPSDSAVPTDTPHNTSTPTLSAEPTVTPSQPATKPPVTVKKGQTYTANNIQYKVLSLKGKKGTVAMIGHKKNVKTADIKKKPSIGKYTFQVTTISKNAFKNCNTLKGSIQLPDTITSIGDNAFYNCKNITKVTIPSNVTSIGKSAFQNCKKLKLVYFKSAKVKKIGAKAFFSNKSGRTFSIPKKKGSYFQKLLIKGKQYN